MKKGFKAIASLMLCMSLISCGGEATTVSETSVEMETETENSNVYEINKKQKTVDVNEDLTYLIVHDDALKLYYDELSDDFKNELGEFKQFEGGYVSTTKEYEENRSYDEQVVFSKSDLIYPGAILQGENLKNNEYINLNLKRNPIDYSVSLQGEGEIRGIIENPRVISSARDSINRLLNQENLSGQAAINFSVDKVSTSNEFDLNLGTGIGLGPVSASFNISPSTKFETERTFAQFTQKYYSIVVDRPEFVSEFFDETVTSDEFLKATNGYMPVYVSSVVYGRRGIFEMNTETSSEALEKSLTVGFGTGINAEGSIGDITTIENEISSMNLYMLGGDSDTAAQAINGYDDFVNHIQSGATFSSDNRGEIIGFELRYLHDNSVAKTVLNEKYAVSEKVPRDRTIKYSFEYLRKNGSTSLNINTLSLYINDYNNCIWSTNKDFQHAMTQFSGNKIIYSDEIVREKTAMDNGKTYRPSVTPMEILYNDINNDTVTILIEFDKNNFEETFKIKDLENNVPIVINGDKVYGRSTDNMDFAITPIITYADIEEELLNESAMVEESQLDEETSNKADAKELTASAETKVEAEKSAPTETEVQTEKPVPAETKVTAEITEQSESIITFAGMIDKYPVHMTMNLKGNEIRGTYYYDIYETDITFVGTKNNNIVELSANNGGEHFSGVLSENSFNGIWNMGSSSFNFEMSKQ